MKIKLFVVLLVCATPALVMAGSWEISGSTNQMTDEKIETATLRSDNSLRLNFPYQGRNFGRISVTRVGDKSLVMVGIERGQILCLQGCSFTARFDDSVPVHFEARPASDMSTDYVVVERSDQFVEWLQGAKKIIIRLDLFQAGSPLLVFSQRRALPQSQNTR